MNVLRERVIVSIHHNCRLQMFCKPQLQLHAPITFLRLASTTHTQAHTLALFTGNPPSAYTENKLNNVPHIPIIENLFTHSLTLQLTYLVNRLADTLYIQLMCMQRKTLNVCFDILQKHNLIFLDMLKFIDH